MIHRGRWLSKVQSADPGYGLADLLREILTESAKWKSLWPTELPNLRWTWIRKDVFDSDRKLA